MSEQLRRLTDAGIEAFKSYLSELKSDGTIPPPPQLLTAAGFSEQIAGGVRVEPRAFASKRDAAEYLAEQLSGFRPADLDRDAGLWSWLALYYFDSVCPVEGSRRKAKEAAHYVFDPANYQRRYRHLLWTPWWILRMMPDHNRLYLNEDLAVHGDLVEQTLSRLVNVIRIPAFREVVDRLYYDETRGTYKRGTMSRNRRGSLYPRLVTRIRQLSLTFDVAAMKAGQIIDALGDEFKGWHSGSASK